jgi:DegV family protein with EDD domain
MKNTGENMIAIVTDSVSDLPPEIARELEITAVPLKVHFGTETYTDRVDLSGEAFYHKLATSTKLPTTSSPNPSIFAETYDTLAEKHSGILGIFLSRKFSGTCEAALQGVKLMKRKCHVEIIDSTLAIMGEGLLAIESAIQARTGSSLDDIIKMTEKTIPRLHVRATLDTLKYLAMGGRIGKAQALLGSMLKINPVLGIKDGEAFPVARERSRAKAVDCLYKFATGFKKVKAFAVEYGTNAAEAKTLAWRISDMFPKIPAYMSNVSPVIGTHTGPNVLTVSVLEE